MKKKHVALIIIGTILFILFIFGSLLGSFDFMRYERIGKTDYYLVENDVIGLHHQYPEEKGFYNVLDGRITDIYWNKQYILATQCAVNSDSIEGYYIVKMLPPVKKGVPWKTTKFETKYEYEQKKQELGLDEKKMDHINLFDNKHIIWNYIKAVAFVGIFLAIAIYVLRGIVRFLKSKAQDNT